MVGFRRKEIEERKEKQLWLKYVNFSPKLWFHVESGDCRLPVSIQAAFLSMSWAVSGFGGFRVYIILRSAAYRKGFCLVMRVGIYSGSFRCLNVFRFYRGSLLCGVSVIGMGWSGDYHNCCGARRKRCVSPRGEARQVLRTCRFSRKAAACTSCFPK